MNSYRTSLLAFAIATATEQELQRQKVTGEDRVTDAMTDAAVAVVLAECGETAESVGDFATMTMRDVQRRAIAAALAKTEKPIATHMALMMVRSARTHLHSARCNAEPQHYGPGSQERTLMVRRLIDDALGNLAELEQQLQLPDGAA